MTAPGRDPRLGAGLARILSLGTVITLLVVGVGFLVAAMTGLPSRGAQPLLQIVLRAGPDAPIAVGLFALTLLPMAALAFAAWRFAVGAERRRLLTTLGVLALLAVELAVAVVIGWSS